MYEKYWALTCIFRLVMHAYVMNQQFGHLFICISIEILYLYCVCQIYITGIYMYLSVYIAGIYFYFYLNIEIPITGEQGLMLQW